VAYAASLSQNTEHEINCNIMRTYIVTSGLLFVLLVAVHVLRLIAEGFGPLANPVFLASTGASAAMAVWARSAYKAAKRLALHIDA
jgi:hypothetical protein